MAKEDIAQLDVVRKGKKYSIHFKSKLVYDYWRQVAIRPLSGLRESRSLSGWTYDDFNSYMFYRRIVTPDGWYYIGHIAEADSNGDVWGGVEQRKDWQGSLEDYHDWLQEHNLKYAFFSVPNGSLPDSPYNYRPSPDVLNHYGWLRALGVDQGITVVSDVPIMQTTGEKLARRIEKQLMDIVEASRGITKSTETTRFTFTRSTSAA